MLSSSQTRAQPLNLGLLRHFVGMTQPDLAAAAGVSVRSISYIEQGRVPRLDTQVRIAAALDRRLRMMGEDSPIFPHRLSHVDLWPAPEADAS